MVSDIPAGDGKIVNLFYSVHISAVFSADERRGIAPIIGKIWS